MSYANLTVTDEAALPGATLRQHLERLDLELADGGRVTASRDAAGAVVLCIDAAGERVTVALPAAAALRLGAHVAGLAAQTLDPEPDTEGESSCLA